MSTDTGVTLPLRPADSGRPAHYPWSGVGPANVNMAGGVQKNYSQNNGSGNRQFIAETINYTEPAGTWPEYIGTYSYTSLKPVKGYVARPELQKQVEERLLYSHAAKPARTMILVLVGLGGAGKSQLTLNYIDTHREDYCNVFWVDARRQESVERDYIQIYGRLFGNQIHSMSLKLDVDRVVTAVKSWFQARDGRWLLVFDNADSLDDETDPYFVDLRRYLPDAPGVEVIITTRSRTAVDITELEAVDVGKLEAAEAVDMFVRCSKIRDPALDVFEEAGRIVAELDYLALAVSLAGAYVAATPRIRSNLGDYLLEYQQRRKTLLNRKAKQQIHRYGESVLSTWETSYTAIVNQCPTAGRLLSFLAFLDPEDIFLELFRPKLCLFTAYCKDRAEEWRSLLSPEATFEEVLDEALEALSMYSLIEWKEGQSRYSMHKLVHTWGFERLETEEQGEYSKSSLAFLKWLTQVHLLDPVTKSRMIPHILSSVTRLREWQRASKHVPESSLDAVRCLATFVEYTGHYHVEFELRSFDYAERERVREKDENGWVRSLSELAGVLGRQGKYEAAEKMSRRALERTEQMHGKEHPYTLTRLNNLALVLQYQGKYEEAEEIHRRALEGSEQVLGKEDLRTLTSVNNLAMVLQYRAKYKEAEKIYQQALEGRERVLGKEHPDTLTCVSNLASVLQYQGKYKVAEEMNQRALEGRERVLGKEHPDTLTSMGNYAFVLQYQCKYKEAEEMNYRALEGREQVLGKEHPDTLTSVINLASVLERQGKYKAAEEMNQRALEGNEKVLGKEHPYTLTSISNLGSVLRHLGKYKASEEMNRRALEGRERVLGKDHPDTLRNIHSLARSCAGQGRLEEAEKLQRHVVAGCRTTFGSQHPHTQSATKSLLHIQKMQERAATDVLHEEIPVAGVQ